MEGKTVIMLALFLSLVLGQIQVEARKSCCPNNSARTTFNVCRFGGASQSICASLSGCQLISGSTCPSGFTHDILENTGDAANEYCKLGCASSVCGAITTLQNFDAGEVVNAAVEKCTMACSALCTKYSIRTA
ncbi:probable thionin-2.4 [Humulus lupulus]|uniref:probable thionin-2.4 n=1 Tax=Humulus lupulus TaxID=3486 RepID=UPI002B417111|nr:probable thionin-2.4 [Humulus lupulus]